LSNFGIKQAYIWSLENATQRECNVEQACHLKDNSDIKLDAMFESSLVISRLSSLFKGYLHSFPDYLKSLSDQKLNISGEVTVDLLNPAVDQLFPEVKQTWDMKVAWMLPFLHLFGKEEGNGLSPFACTFKSPEELVNMVEKYFGRPQSDQRGRDHCSDDGDDVNGKASSNGGDDETGDGTRDGTADNFNVDSIMHVYINDLKCADKERGFGEDNTVSS